MVLFGGLRLYLNVETQEKPKFVPIVMDNSDWGEIGYYGGGILRGAEMPRIDTLAAKPAGNAQKKFDGR